MLNQKDWLPKAKRLAIGMQDRVYHLNEKRPNLVIGNAGDRYWAYCQACKEGGIERKEHVRLTGFSPEAKRSDLSLPRDLVRILNMDEHERYPLLAFLASKGMDTVMLPELWYSCTRKRILMVTESGWLGRDVSDHALEKWLTYNKAKYLSNQLKATKAVVVEDAFSYFKVRWATLDTVAVYCALGTGIKDSLTMALLKHGEVIFMFDGDSAGWDGADKGSARLRGLGIRSYALCAPAGLDPKDLQAETIRNLIGEHK